ncbi:sulfotransferase domain-containing protein [Altericista sp. CCNU0014]|uniref:sulfotransferase domain-containing protein n=1 Tax=Altericista sp. CCNU0014 TaxID=3082949 RepID=UPI0038502398
MKKNSVKNILRRAISIPIKSQKIIQFSPPRSGSTLIYNILRDVFPEKDIEKLHVYRYAILKSPIVITYRHPLDCIASSIQRYGLVPTDEVIEKQVVEFEQNGIWDILRLRDEKNVLMLRYEEFVSDFDKIFEGIEVFFGIFIPLEKRKIIADRYQIKNIEKIVRSKNTFDEYDEVTHWHGKHISKYKGKPYYYKKFFQDGQIKYLKNIYKDYLTAFNYN